MPWGLFAVLSYTDTYDGDANESANALPHQSYQSTNRKSYPFAYCETQSIPTAVPFPLPTAVPTLKFDPTAEPSPRPTAGPSPSAEPTLQPTPSPTAQPTTVPTKPSPQPTPGPTAVPSIPVPSPQPTPGPTASPSQGPTPLPTAPTASPTFTSAPSYPFCCQTDADCIGPSLSGSCVLSSSSASSPNGVIITSQVSLTLSGLDSSDINGNVALALALRMAMSQTIGVPVSAVSAPSATTASFAARRLLSSVQVSMDIYSSLSSNSIQTTLQASSGKGGTFLSAFAAQAKLNGFNGDLSSVGVSSVTATDVSPTLSPTLSPTTILPPITIGFIITLMIASFFCIVAVFFASAYVCCPQFFKRLTCRPEEEVHALQLAKTPDMLYSDDQRYLFSYTQDPRVLDSLRSYPVQSRTVPRPRSTLVDPPNEALAESDSISVSDSDSTESGETQEQLQLQPPPAGPMDLVNVVGGFLCLSPAARPAQSPAFD